MKIQWKRLIICLALPLGVGGLSALLTKDAMESFGALEQPPLSPPGWLFPVVWTALYILMGLSSYLVLSSGKASRTALEVYGVQLGVNFFWSIFFFNFGWYLFSFLWLVLLLALVIAMILLFFRVSRAAAYLMVPYLLWVSFAGYLNLFIYLLN